MRRAILLGLLQGPTELAPISSSAHTALLRQRWGGHAKQEAAFRKSFEVALHGGTVCALLLAMGRPLRGTFRRSCSHAGPRSYAGRRSHAGPRSQAGPHSHAGGQRSRLRLGMLSLSLLPPALTGALLERPIERRLAGRQPIAAGLLIGALAMALADRRQGKRTVEQAGLRDGLALGLAQAAALMPGISRRGATLAVARLRGFTRQDADALSWLVALPVIVGACALKSLRIFDEGAVPVARRRELAAGVGASFLSTMTSVRLLRTRLDTTPLAPFCAYRVVLALLILA